MEEFLSKNKINFEEMNTENVPKNEVVNEEVNENDKENVNVSDPPKVEDILISPNEEDKKKPMETKVPKVVLAKEKVVQNEDVEMPKINLEIVSEEHKAEGEKFQEIRMEARDTAKVVKRSLMEQYEDFDPELDESSINISTFSPIQMMKVASISQAKAGVRRF